MDISVYKKEFSRLKPYDQIQSHENLAGYHFLHTAGHGYLVIPREDQHISTADKLCEYGFKGHHAIYLEEDSERFQFLEAIK